jgi:CRISPR-associated endonuclease/helicase Cas3
MKPYPFFECLAHENDWLPNHLLRVAEAAEITVVEAGEEIRHIAFLSGLLHDLGKATPFFQIDRLQKKKKNRLTSHSESSACIGWKISEQLSFPLWMRLSILIAIMRHHGNLKFNSWENAYGTIRQKLKSNEELSFQLKSLDWENIFLWISPIIARHFQKINLNQKEFSIPAFHESFSAVRMSRIRNCFQEISNTLCFLAGYGSLLSADKVDSAIGSYINRIRLPSGLVEKYKTEKFGLPNSRMNRLRETISHEVFTQWNSNPDHRLFTLTAPTGSGKTLAIFNAALEIRSRLSKSRQSPPRIIYCLPFTSVIDQNHKVMADVMRDFGLGRREDILLKHHHLVPGLYRTEESEFDAEDAGAVLTETWQSEIVITTFFQFLHSLISASNSELKRAGHLCGSIVLMDEVQTIPLRYWETIRYIFGKAIETLNMTFVLLTATRPLIFRQDDPAIKELLPNHPAYFRKLSRVTLFCHSQKIGLSSFCNRIIENLQKEYRSSLIILNRRASVKTVYTKLKTAFPTTLIMMLSTDLTPWDRRANIRLIQWYLKKKLPCLIVSTQLVEAGVDFSFPVVHREMAPLDSIIQSCGRSNRHYDASNGEVHLWIIHKEDENNGELKEPLWSKIYDVPLINSTIESLGISTKKHHDMPIKFEERDFLNLSQNYFNGCWKRIEQEDVTSYWTKGDFPGLEKQFKLIEDTLPRLTCFVLQNPIDANIWQEYQEIYRSDLDSFERKKRFKKIRAKFYERVIQVQVYGKRSQEFDPVILLNSPEHYSRETGFIKLPEKDSTCVF